MEKDPLDIEELKLSDSHGLSNNFKSIGLDLMPNAMDDATIFQTNPFGSLDEFLDDDKFEIQFNRTKETLVTEEKAGGGYRKDNVKTKEVKRRERAWVFIIITETQNIQDALSNAHYIGLKQKPQTNEYAVAIF